MSSNEILNGWNCVCAVLVEQRVELIQGYSWELQQNLKEEETRPLLSPFDLLIPKNVPIVFGYKVKLLKIK